MDRGRKCCTRQSCSYSAFREYNSLANSHEPQADRGRKSCNPQSCPFKAALNNQPTTNFREHRQAPPKTNQRQQTSQGLIQSQRQQRQPGSSQRNIVRSQAIASVGKNGINSTQILYFPPMLRAASSGEKFFDCLSDGDWPENESLNVPSKGSHHSERGKQKDTPRVVRSLEDPSGFRTALKQIIIMSQKLLKQFDEAFRKDRKGKHGTLSANSSKTSRSTQLEISATITTDGGVGINKDLQLNPYMLRFEPVSFSIPIKVQMQSAYMPQISETSRCSHQQSYMEPIRTAIISAMPVPLSLHSLTEPPSERVSSRDEGKLKMITNEESNATSQTVKVSEPSVYSTRGENQKQALTYETVVLMPPVLSLKAPSSEMKPERICPCAGAASMVPTVYESTVDAVSSREQQSRTGTSIETSSKVQQSQTSRRSAEEENKPMPNRSSIETLSRSQQFSCPCAGATSMASTVHESTVDEVSSRVQQTQSTRRSTEDEIKPQQNPAPFEVSSKAQPLSYPCAAVASAVRTVYESAVEKVSSKEEQTQTSKIFTEDGTKPVPNHSSFETLSKVQQSPTSRRSAEEGSKPMPNRSSIETLSRPQQLSCPCAGATSMASTVHESTIDEVTSKVQQSQTSRISTEDVIKPQPNRAPFEVSSKSQQFSCPCAKVASTVDESTVDEVSSKAQQSSNSTSVEPSSKAQQTQTSRRSSMETLIKSRQYSCHCGDVASTVPTLYESIVEEALSRTMQSHIGTKSFESGNKSLPSSTNTPFFSPISSFESSSKGIQSGTTSLQGGTPYYSPISMSESFQPPPQTQKQQSSLFEACSLPSKPILKNGHSTHQPQKECNCASESFRKPISQIHQTSQQTLPDEGHCPCTKSASIIHPVIPRIPTIQVAAKKESPPCPCTAGATSDNSQYTRGCPCSSNAVIGQKTAPCPCQMATLALIRPSYTTAPIPTFSGVPMSTYSGRPIPTHSDEPKMEKAEMKELISRELSQIAMIPPPPPPKPPVKTYRLAYPQQKDLKLCVKCRFDPSPLIDENGRVFCPGSCGCCLCPWKPRHSELSEDRLKHSKLIVCKCREKISIFTDPDQRSACSNADLDFDVCPCREKAEATFLETYGQEMWTKDEKLLEKFRGNEVLLSEVVEIIPHTPSSKK